MTTKDDKNLYELLSEERKQLQAEDRVPVWYSTAGWQMFKDKYLYQANDVREQFTRIANTAARHLRHVNLEHIAKKKFFNLLWNGDVSSSTPVLANMGTDRGLPVSCSGGLIHDSIDGFYSHRREIAILTKCGFGTSGYLGGIRPRGSDISIGGKASGVLPVFKGIIQDMRDVAQGTARRGAYAGYLEVDHGDFDEVCDFIHSEPDDANIGWIITNEYLERLEVDDPDSVRRFKKMMKLKMVHGKGYFFFVDKANAHRPEMYVKHNLYINNSNLCSEIMLFNDEEHTFTCVLSSMNVARYGQWDEDAVFWATIFLDCVAEEFLTKARNIPGLEKAVRFTEKGRALGLGQCGFHTLLQKRRIPYESFDAHMLSNQIAKHIWEESLRASKYMAEILGEPEWCKGYGVRNTHRIAIAPTKSTANLMGGVSEGINLDPAMIYTASGAAGELDRINPELLAIMKERGKFTKKIVKEIAEDYAGSVQHCDWLTDHEKLVFKTGFEINQKAHTRMCSSRGRWIDQWQSLNYYFAAEESEGWISEVHQEAFLDPNILATYYIYTQAGVSAAKGECEACQ